jgi:outer membrane murein-binding lipoprotein Lpp
MGGRNRLTRLAAMPGTNRIPPLLALVAAVAALSGCGSSDDIKGQIPATNADQLNAALDTVSSAVASNDCATASSGADGFIDAVNELPATAGADLKEALQEAGANLRALVDDQCPPSGATGPSGAQPPASSSTPSTTESSTSSTTDSTTTTTTTTTSSTEETQPQDGNGGDNGQGNGNGGGQGGGGDGGTGGTGG